MTSVQVSVAGGRCPQCGTALCLTARISTAGRSIGLCPACDSGNPHAAQLIQYFEDNQAVAPQHRYQIADLLGRWLGSLDGHRAAAQPSLAEAAEAWWAARRVSASET